MVDSVLGKGTRFQFVLELAPAAVGEGAGSSESCEESAKSPQQHRLRLLVVDDVELNRELTLAMLGSGGHMVDLACNGKEALEFLNRYSYDLVLMDVRMPVMDGLAATRAIRENPALKTLPVIALTAQALPDQISECERAGMSDHLPKPITNDALNAILAKWGGEPRVVDSAGDEREALERLQTRFLHRCAQELRLLTNRDEERPEDLHEAIHRLAGSLRLFGFTEAGDAAARLDKQIQTGREPEDADYLVLIRALKSLQENPSPAQI